MQLLPMVSKRNGRTRAPIAKPIYVWGACTLLTIVFVAVIIATVFSVQQRAPLSGARTMPQSQLSASATFSETFSTTTFEDTGATTANWNTATGSLVLPSGPSNYYEANRSTVGADNASSSPGSSNFAALALDSLG